MGTRPTPTKGTSRNKLSTKTSRCVTTKLQLWLLTMAPACARLDSPETMPPGCFPLHCGTPSPSGRYGGYGPEGLLCRRRGPVQEGYPHPEVPHRAWHHHQLGRHGEDLAPHFLQRAACGSRGAPHPPDRGSPQPQGQQGEDDPDHV